MTETLDRVNKGIHVERDRGVTFARDLDDWLAGNLALKPSTRLSYVHHITLYLKPGLGHIRLSELRDTDFQELYAAMRQLGRPRSGRPSPMLARLLAARTNTPQARRALKPAPIRRIHATAMSALNAAVKRGRSRTTPLSTSSSSAAVHRGLSCGPMSGLPRGNGMGDGRRR